MNDDEYRRKIREKSNQELLNILAHSNEYTEAALSRVKDDLSRFLRIAEKEEVVITRHGKPAAVLIGFQTEDDWLDYRLENDPRFLRRVEAARKSLRSGRGLKLEDVRP